MSSLILPALMRSMLHQTADRQEMRRGALILDALSQDDPDALGEALNKAKEAGVSLEQVGSVALASDRDRVGQVLRDRFGIFPEHYLTTGGESGIDSRQGYPYLLHLCHFQKKNQLRRAIAWGADPNATWQVDGLLCNYERKPQQVSLVSEAIRGLNGGITKTLLEQAAPPDTVEQHRRLSALWESTHRINRTSNHDRSNEIALGKLISLLGPGGKHALTSSFWQVDRGKLGVEMAVAISRNNPAFDRDRVEQLFLPWLQKTAEADGKWAFRVIDAHLDGNSYAQFRLPEWAVEALTVDQARGALQKALFRMAEYAIGKLGNNSGFGDQSLVRHLEDCVPALASLIDKAFQGTELTGCERIMPTLGKLTAQEFRKLTVQSLDEIYLAWPARQADVVAADNDLAPLREVLVAIEAEEKTRPAGSGVMISSDLVERRAMLHAHANLAADTPGASLGKRKAARM